MGAETLDLTFRSLDHLFEIADEFLVYRVVGSTERIDGGCAGSVQNPEHREVSVSVSRHAIFAASALRVNLLNLTRSLGAGVGGYAGRPMDAREERLARNETLFRSVNENIEKAATSGWPDEHTFEFFCECSNVDCNLLLPMTVSAYENVRADPKQFIVAPGHELPEIENVVLRTDSYQVVVKEGEAAEFVAEHDPRSE